MKVAGIFYDNKRIKGIDQKRCMGKSFLISNFFSRKKIMMSAHKSNDLKKNTWPERFQFIHAERNIIDPL
jgi:hypothetical protein